jgi:hypothetical protein
MPRLKHDERTPSSVERGHLKSVICGQPSSALIEPCAAPCWRRSDRRTRHADLGREGQTDAARSPTHDADGRAPRRGGHPHGTRPRGRRPHQGRPPWVGRRHPGGADDAPGPPGTDGGDECTECLTSPQDTVFRFVSHRLAIALSDWPLAAARTIRPRSTTCCGVPCAASHC